MPSNNTIASVLADGAKIVDVWTANPTFMLGTITLESFKGQLSELQTTASVVETKRTELTGLLIARDEKSTTMSDLISRARSGFRAAFGPDSTQYEQAGGTRRSERKSAKRKASTLVPA
jgi:hypothetical protein